MSAVEKKTSRDEKDEKADVFSTEEYRVRSERSHCPLATLLVPLTSLGHTFEGHVCSLDAAVAARMRERASWLRQEGAQWPLTLTTTPSAPASIPLPH